MASPVTAESNGGTYLLRWYAGGIGVTRNHEIAVCRLGFTFAYAEATTDVLVAVEHAHTCMELGLWAEVAAMGTHRWAWRWLSLRRELVPIEPTRRVSPVWDSVDDQGWHRG